MRIYGILAGGGSHSPPPSSVRREGPPRWGSLSGLVKGGSLDLDQRAAPTLGSLVGLSENLQVRKAGRPTTPLDKCCRCVWADIFLAKAACMHHRN